MLRDVDRGRATDSGIAEAGALTAANRSALRKQRGDGEVADGRRADFGPGTCGANAT